MKLLKKERTQVVNIIVFSVLGVLLTSSCFIIKQNSKLEDVQNDVLKDNCAGYTLNYTNKVAEERDSVTIYGKVRFCSSNKIPPKTKISFYGTNDNLKYQTEMDDKGYYEIKITKGHYSRIQADCYGASLIIPSVDLGTVGDAGGAMEIDMKLLRHFIDIFINSTPLTKKDIRQIKKNRKQNKD